MPSVQRSGAEQLTKQAAVGDAGSKARSETEFVVKILSLEAVCAFVRAHGDRDRAAAWVASQQLSMITAVQLGAVGIDKDGIVVRRRRGTLHRCHRGVYLLGPPPLLPGAKELAAVLACGPAALISHRSAAALWGLAKPPTDGVRLTVVGESRRHRGLRIHRVDQLHPADRSQWHGVPVTSPARSLIDFASEAGLGELERAIAEGRALRLIPDRALTAAIKRAPRRPGVGAVKAELRREGGPLWTKSEGERHMLRLIRAARLPPPHTQVRIAGFEADFLWPEPKLIVEVDGFQFHGHRAAFERDRKRDAAHVLAGYRVIRFTWRQLTDEPLAVAVTIARALEARGGDTAS